MASAQSMALRSVPGYAPKPAVSAAYSPTYPTTPDIPAAPDYGGRTNPATAGRQQWITTQLGSLPGKYAPILGASKAQAKAGLAGYGGWSFKTDDPSTPQDESLLLEYDPSKGLGEKEKQAVQGEDAGANARGLLSSSFRNKAVGAALQRMNEQARAVVNQYAAQIASTLGQQQSERSQLTGELVSLFGEDAAYFAENPIKPPDWMAPAGTVGDVWAGYHQPDENGLKQMYPGMTFSYRTDPDGRVVVSASPIPQAAAAPAAGQLATPTSQPGSYPTWQGSSPPNLKTLADRWGVPQSAIRVTPLGNGKYRAWAQASPPGSPGAGAFG
jgi:hypothetical protein